MDITLADTITLEPNLILTRGVCTADGSQFDLEHIEVSWAVSARTTAPHLPTLRGQEMLLIPGRVASDIRGSLPALVREANSRRVSAIVVADGDASELDSIASLIDVPMLWWRGELTSDVEMLINRRITECRGELYRIGSELERQLADLTVSRAGVEPFVQMASHTTGLPISVFDTRGIRFSSTQLAIVAHRVGNTERHAFISQEFGGGAIELGPLRAEERVIARFLVPRLALAAEVALQLDDAARPRGRSRIAATAALLAGRRGSMSDQRAAALALGLDPDAMFLVAICRGGTETSITRALAPLGDVRLAGSEHDHRKVLIAASGIASVAGLAARMADVKSQWMSEHVNDEATLAFSAPAVGVANLPEAAGEAEFVFGLQSQALFPKRAAAFGSVDDVGVLRLLYYLRDSSELRRFVDDTLGTLESRDRRGALRSTLRAFLECGGSQVDASQRLGIHRNTLAYRLRRIGELLGRDIADPGSWLTLHFALRASEMLDACSTES